MGLDEIRKRLEFMNLAKVGRKCGIHRELLSRFMRGDSDLSAINYIKVSNFLENLEAKK